MFSTLKLTFIDHGVLALRWGLDVARGYHRAMDSKESVLRCLKMSAEADRRETAEAYADSALAVLRDMGEARAERGGGGVGARFALSSFEFVQLRVQAEELRSEALGHHVVEGAQAG